MSDLHQMSAEEVIEHLELELLEGEGCWYRLLWNNGSGNAIYGMVTPREFSALHVLAEAYPEQPEEDVRKACRRLLRSLARLLPCAHCREHFTSFCSSRCMRQATMTRASLRGFLVEAHANAGSREPYRGDPSRDYGLLPARAASESPGVRHFFENGMLVDHDQAPSEQKPCARAGRASVEDEDPRPATAGRC